MRRRSGWRGTGRLRGGGRAPPELWGARVWLREDLGPGFPLLIDLNRDEGGHENSLLVPREVTAEQQL